MVCHCGCDAGEGGAAELPAVLTGWQEPDPRLAALDDVRRLELRQPLEPEAGPLHLAMAELPGLDGLVRLPDVRRDDRHGVLQRDAWHRRVEQALHELQCSLLPAVGALLREPTCAAHGEVGAGWVRDHQVELRQVEIEHVALVVRARLVGREQVAAHGVVATLDERVADGSAVFASDEDLHDVTLGAMANTITMRMANAHAAMTTPRLRAGVP